MKTEIIHLRKYNKLFTKTNMTDIKQRLPLNYYLMNWDRRIQNVVGLNMFEDATPPHNLRQWLTKG